MEASSESLTLSRIPDRVTQMFRLAQDELQLNRSYFAQLISSRCAKLDSNLFPNFRDPAIAGNPD
jgi:hypothetical protein